MLFKIKNLFFVCFAALACLIFTNSCSLEDAEIVRAPPPEDLVIKRERERREALGAKEDDSFVGNLFKDITGLGKEKKSSGGAGIAVNTFLWRASLDSLSFMPLLSADPFGGVIITDWYSTSPTSKEKFKVVAYILDKELRVDALKVSVFKRLKNEEGDWVDSKGNSALKNKVEDAILTKARKYKIQSIK
ncbi:MAG: hypothetical protein CMJ12_01115 [Pelagibacterales bacterium]|nr:hypothetical protein [Pelagibacterales bacterium]PPR16625.1 MAG: hypothetical protein CFH33_00529 [Alphaproteobacteria bacterium MarineAlpha9_Bin3]|tara:strand:- start:43996 stop:44565 length:570 start_codon:yes stop_codon:yes gene_type:complete